MTIVNGLNGTIKAAIEELQGLTVVPSVLGAYLVDTAGTTPPVASGDIIYNNATQASATNLYLNKTTYNGTDINTFLALLTTGTKIIIQDQANTANYQVFTIGSTPSFSTPTWTIPVTLTTSGGTGTTNFANNLPVYVAYFGGGGGSGSGTVNSGSQYRIPYYSTNPTGTVLDAQSAITPSKIVTSDANGLLVGSYTFRDQDDMSSDDATGIPSQQSVKAYVDNVVVTESQYAKIQAIWYHLNSF